MFLIIYLFPLRWGFYIRAAGFPSSPAAHSSVFVFFCTFNLHYRVNKSLNEIKKSIKYSEIIDWAELIQWTLWTLLQEEETQNANVFSCCFYTQVCHVVDSASRWQSTCCWTPHCAGSLSVSTSCLVFESQQHSVTVLHSINRTMFHFTAEGRGVTANGQAQAYRSIFPKNPSVTRMQTHACMYSCGNHIGSRPVWTEKQTASL